MAIDHWCMPDDEYISKRLKEIEDRRKYLVEEARKKNLEENWKDITDVDDLKEYIQVILTYIENWRDDR